MYMARQLSFAGVSFDIRDVKLSQDFIEMYDAAVKLVSIAFCNWKYKIMQVIF